MNLTYWAIDTRRVARNVSNIFFIVCLPVVMYLVFGSASSFSTEPVRNGNVSAVVMVSMAVYGAVTATTTIGAGAAMERFQGWGRQLALTPWPARGFVATKSAVAMTIAIAPVIAVGAAGAATGASATPAAWMLSLGLAWLGSAVFALYGLAVATAFRSDSALGVASGLLVLLAFAGNMFIPLSGIALSVSRFTPLYGVNLLARYPLTGGAMADGTAEQLWIPILNVAVWTVIMGAITVVLAARRRAAT